MNDGFVDFLIARRAPFQTGEFLVTTEFGSYLNTKDSFGKELPLRQKSLEQLQADWCITKACQRNAEDDMNANAIAAKHFHGNEEERHLYERHCERHEVHSRSYGDWENKAIAIQEEMVWRMENPDYDSDDPFKDE